MKPVCMYESANISMLENSNCHLGTVCAVHAKLLNLWNISTETFVLKNRESENFD